MREPVLKIENLSVCYPVRSGFSGLGRKRFLKAVDDVSLDLWPRETLGIVGESGCGKTSLGKALIRLIKLTTGKVAMGEIDFLALQGEELRKARKNIQMVFQDPYGSLDPRMTVFDILSEPLKAYSEFSSTQIHTKVRTALDRVGLPLSTSRKYPHEFSGGQRQRIAIARALIPEPKILVADEPLSSLDVSVQAQILNLLKTIQQELGLSMIFISHNLAVVKYIANRIAVMYLGKVVEMASRDELYKHPRHPYTQALVSAVPIPEPQLEKMRKRIRLFGELPSPLQPPPGCSFHTRCPMATGKCRQSEPPVARCGTEGTQLVRCFEVN
ncbi:MAG: ATP-binding cassette domain-containing protein [Deltaproteobacteria bacterium]|nr:ATP-binding cassette domain-containing protein [Deltaproteobacteria bacterium]